MAYDLASEFLKDVEEEEEELLGDDADDGEVYMDDEIWEIPDAVQIYIQNRDRPKETLAALLNNEELVDFVKQLELYLDKRNSGCLPDGISQDDIVNMLSKCNAALSEVDREILDVYRHIKEIYSKRFPELETIISSPLDYIAVAVRLRNDLDTSMSGGLSDVLPNTMVMAVTVAASMTIGSPLSPTELNQILNASEEINKMVDIRKTMLHYIEVNLCRLAPNLTSLAGAALAARLVTHAGSLKDLADMPAQNILNIGGSAYSRATSAFSANHSNVTGLPAVGRRTGRGYGLIWHSDIVQSAPHMFKVRAMRLLAGKCGLAARSDHYKPDTTGTLGRDLREHIIKAIKKMQEPPPPQMKKILPIPDDRPKPRRGGKRSRRAKEKYGMSELQKQANRLRFGLEAEGDYGLEEVQTSLGMITDVTSKLKNIPKEAQKLKTPKKPIQHNNNNDFI